MIDLKSNEKPAWTVDATTVGRTIAEGRRTLGLTQEELARRLGVTKAAVSKWEQAASLPDISLLPGIASQLDLTVDELLGWDPQLSEDETAAIMRELREGFARNAARTFARAKRVAVSHWRCWQALAGIASEIMYATRIPAESETERMVPDGSTRLPDDLMRTMLDECIAICEHVERDSGDAVAASLAVSTHAAAMIRRKDDPLAIIAFVEPFMQPMPPLGGKSGLASLHLLAGDRDRAAELTRSAMTAAIAELSQATLMWMTTGAEAESILACVDAFEALAAAYGDIAGGAHIAILVPTMRVSAAVPLAAQSGPHAGIDQLERAVDELLRIDATAFAGNPNFEGSPEVLARAICTPEAWGTLADEPRYQALVSRLSEVFGL